jgi:hypothetical protein
LTSCSVDGVLALIQSASRWRTPAADVDDETASATRAIELV